jgi:hypothetical protein
MALVKMYEVRIPARTSQVRFVPRYDVEILRLLWPQKDLIPEKQIDVLDHGMLAFKPLAEELERIQRDYATKPDGSDQPAWQAVHGNLVGFTQAWKREADIGADLQAKVQEFRRLNPAKPDASAPSGDGGQTTGELSLGDDDEGGDDEHDDQAVGAKARGKKK